MAQIRIIMMMMGTQLVPSQLRNRSAKASIFVAELDIAPEDDEGNKDAAQDGKHVPRHGFSSAGFQQRVQYGQRPVPHVRRGISQAVQHFGARRLRRWIDLEQIAWIAPIYEGQPFQNVLIVGRLAGLKPAQGGRLDLELIGDLVLLKPPVLAPFAQKRPGALSWWSFDGRHGCDSDKFLD